MDYNVNDIKKYMDLFPFTPDDKFSEEETYEFVNRIDENLFDIFDYNSGATKFVIIPYDSDYVVKIPFNYISRSSSSFEQSSGSIWDAGQMPFTNASLNDEYGWDYCALEEDVYSLAKKEGWDKFFTEVQRVREVTQYPTYIQKKIKMLNYSTKGKRKEEYLSKSRDFCLKNRVRYACPNWWADVLETFNGKESDFLNFLSFLKEYELDEDLHGNNVGYDIDTGMPIICDYAGFREYQTMEWV